MEKNHKKSTIQFIKFIFFSISAGVIQMASFSLFHYAFSWNYDVSYLTSLSLSVLWNFTLNRKFTFQAANNVPIAMLKVAAFYVVFTPLSTWGGDSLEKSGWPGILVLALTMVINFISEFFYCKYFVFKESAPKANE